jgi:HlyD family secretion protein
MSQSIFRKKALDKISSPEQLDTLIKVTSPANWLVLLAFAIIITVCILWGIFGRIPTKVKGTGILLSARNITKLQSHVSGEIISLNVEAGDLIKKGQVLARLKQPLLEKKIKLLINRVEELKGNLSTFDDLNLRNLKQEIDYLDLQEINIKKSIDDLIRHRNWLADRVERSRKLRTKGAISEVDYYKIEKEFSEAKLNVHKEKNKLQDIVYKRLQSISELKKEHLQKKHEAAGIAEKELQLKEYLFELKRASVFLSPVSGRILELNVGENQIIKEGEDFLTLISNQRTVDLEAIVYFPAGDGKKIKNGMNAQIAPLTVKITKYGYIKGIVEEVNIYPSSTQGMLNTLQNQELIKKLSAGGAPIKIKIDLIPSSKTVSGLQWTSSKGPPEQILNGTICTANIIVKEDPPISFVIPLFRKYILGIEDNN